VRDYLIELGTIFNGAMSFGEVNCSQNQELCKKYSSLPLPVIYPAKTEKNQNPREITMKRKVDGAGESILWDFLLESIHNGASHIVKGDVVIANKKMDEFIMKKAPIFIYLYFYEKDDDSRSAKNKKFMKIFQTLNALVPQMTFVDINCSIAMPWCKQVGVNDGWVLANGFNLQYNFGIKIL